MLIFDKGCAFYFQRDIRCFVRPCPEALCTFFFQGQRNRVILGCKQEASTQLPASRETSWESSQRELYVKISNITFASVSLFSCLLFKPTSSCFKEKKKKYFRNQGKKEEKISPVRNLLNRPGVVCLVCLVFYSLHFLTLRSRVLAR